MLKAKIDKIFTIDRNDLIRKIFYVSVFLFAIIPNSPDKTITISKSHNLYFPLGSLIFFIGGLIITFLGIKILPKMPKALLFSGPLFSIYVIFQISLKIFFGANYGFDDIFYTIIELININLAIFSGYCYFKSLKNIDVFSELRLLSDLILVILVFYSLAIYASDLITPTIKNITRISINIGSLEFGIPKRLGYRRLYGPLGNPSQLGLILIPICGCHLFLLQKKAKLNVFLRFIIATILIFLTGAKAPVFAYLLLLIYYLCFRLKWKSIYFVNLLLVLILVGINFGLLFPSRVNPLLIDNYIDKNRISAFITSSSAWLSSASSFLFGVGYNELIVSTKKIYLSAAGLMENRELFTKFGFLPGGAHSMFNWAILNTGFAGTLLYCAFIYHFFFSVIKKIPAIFQKDYSIVIVAVSISFIHLFTSIVHISRPALVACWVVFYISSVYILSRKHSSKDILINT